MTAAPGVRAWWGWCEHGHVRHGEGPCGRCFVLEMIARRLGMVSPWA